MAMNHAVEAATLADLLERILDKGVVIAGDVKIKLCDIELLTIQIRLVVCSVDKAKEIGIDFWSNNPAFNPQAAQQAALPSPESLFNLEQRLAKLEGAV